ncbi:hypothetical protein IFM61606_07891 [Aspergillus udagawae]|nr:hypothetical protein IFM61606_07891 [Aspergillus udagawae]
MLTRRPHRKSRTGCTECKRRKIKCDEKYPLCFNCERRGLQCSLAISRISSAAFEPGRPPQVSNVESLTSAVLSSHSVLANASSSSLLAVPPQIWHFGMELMHHYSTVTADTFAVRPDMQYVWRIVVPEMGQRSPFVTHGILAVAAQHKAHLLPGLRDKYLDMAAYHQVLGLEGFRAALSNVNHENWKPSFTFSSIIVIYLFVLVRGLRTTLLRDAQLGETELAPWSHGVWILGEYANNIYEQDPSPNCSRLPPDMFSALRRLSGFLNTTLPESSKDDYEVAVKYLRKAATLIAHAGTRSEIGMAMFFPYVIPENIIADIQAANPCALLLLSYFALLLKAVEDQFWYIRGWPTRLWAAADEHTKDYPKMQKMLEWPKAQAYKLYRH